MVTGRKVGQHVLQTRPGHTQIPVTQIGPASHHGHRSPIEGDADEQGAAHRCTGDDVDIGGVETETHVTGTHGLEILPVIDPATGDDDRVALSDGPPRSA